MVVVAARGSGSGGTDVVEFCFNFSLHQNKSPGLHIKSSQNLMKKISRENIHTSFVRYTSIPNSQNLTAIIL